MLVELIPAEVIEVLQKMIRVGAGIRVGSSGVLCIAVVSPRAQLLASHGLASNLEGS